MISPGDVRSGRLKVVVDDAGAVRVLVGGRDMLGAGLALGVGPAAGCTITAHAGAGTESAVLTLHAAREVTGIATGRFDEPSIGIAFDPATRPPLDADGCRSFGHQYTEFAMPTRPTRR